ncbi:MAG: class I SAM-dependent methyltransferase [Desulfobacterales bacterium]|jgi:ubiquinone/menaquinone biosynthesis C-methylase UbiE|nr:class I SAM-dependent methyltransferase [Desulfobacterales bacterium]
MINKMTILKTISTIFDPIADIYDRWYDEPEGNAIFREETECLSLLRGDISERWLEIGVGTGRFAEALGITHGIDISLPMTSKAVRRGVHVCIGRAEQLPYQKQVFDGVLIALTLCFLENPAKVLQESSRVLRENGTLILGTVPADSPWGRAYIRKGEEGHPVYAHAHFLTIKETVHLFEKMGFELRRGCSALFWAPDTPSSGVSRVEPGIASEAGFVGLLFDAHHAGV